MNKFLLSTVLMVALLLISCNTTSKKDGDQSQPGAELDATADSVQQQDSLNVSDTTEVVEPITTENNAEQTVNFSPRGEQETTKVNDSFILDKYGVGDVKLGANVSALPSKIDGLYNQKKMVSYGNEGDACLFYENKEQIIEAAYDKKDNRITQIRITSPSIKTDVGIQQFMKYNTLLKNDKVRQLIGNIDKDDVFDFTLDGITYELDENIKGDKYVSAIVVKK